jgi:RNA polymerase sigma-70 factor (ECF subfamily)
MIAGLGARDEQAARHLFDRYVHHLVAMARSRLNHRIRQKLDPEDVVQSVYLSFFLRNQRGQFELTDWDSLWAVLAVITLRKCHRWNTRFQRRARDVSVEVPVHGEACTDWEPLARGPRPEEAAALSESIDNLLSSLNERDQDIVRCALRGMATSEISVKVGRSERTVMRVLERVKAELRADGSARQESRPVVGCGPRAEAPLPPGA